MRAIELRQLRYFSILANELHFGRAAELACVTQSALSQQVAKLEEAVGVPLFKREPRKVTLTPSGEALLEGIGKIFSQIESALKNAREASLHNELRLSIGMVEYTNLPFVPPALTRLQALYHDMKIIRHEMHAPRQIAALVNGDIDVGFGVPVELESDLPTIKMQALLNSEWALLMRRSHHLAALSCLRLEDLAGERIIVPARTVNPALYDTVVAQCLQAGFKPNFIYETMQAQVGITLVEQGLGVMLGAPYLFNSLPPSLCFRIVEGLDQLSVNMFWRSNETRTLVLEFVALAAEEASRAQINLDSAL